jgi:predicted Zn-dependent peptidase
MRSFVDYNAIPLKKRATTKATYTGGASLVDGDSAFCHMAIGLESPGWGTGLPAVSVLQTLLGSGSAVNKAPGSGLTSRLGQIVAQNGAIESLSAFNSTYSDSGLFGVYAVCEPSAAGAVATSVTKALSDLANASADDINKAKVGLKANLLRQIDDSATLMKDIGTQMVLSGKYATPAEFCAVVDGVTAAQVTAAAKTILSSKPTVVGFGDTHAVPHYSVLEAALK